MKPNKTILIINICKEKLHYLEFVKPIEDILKENGLIFETKHYKKIIDKDLKAEKIIICGTSLKDNDFLKNLEYFKWIKIYEKPIFGICGGMQIISLIYDGELKNIKEIGEVEVLFKKEFLKIKEKIKAYVIHSQYVESAEFENFAYSSKCIQAIKHKTKPFYGTLFHPEVRNKGIIINFCKL